MADIPTQQPPEEHEVNIPVVQTGTIQFMNKSAVTNPAPDKLKRVLTAIRYTFVSLITATAGTTLFTGNQSKVISFCLGVGIIVCGGIELGTGVKPSEDNSK